MAGLDDPRRYCSVKFTVTVMMTGTGTPLSSVGVNCPLLHRVERRLVEQRDRAQHLRVLDAAVGADRRLDDHDALHARRLRDRRIDRLDVLDLASAS